MEETNVLSETASQARMVFESRYKRVPEMVVAAPGRVNLIGEHVDYHGGIVMPLAIDRYVSIAVSKCDDRGDAGTQRTALIYSAHARQELVVDLDQPLVPIAGSWTNYVTGVIAGFQQMGAEIPAFEAVIVSSLPVGGGLSSSAAIEVAVATMLEAILRYQLSPVDKAVLCQTAEHHFAGMPCGLMDQLASVFGQVDRLMLIDCQRRLVSQVPFEDKSKTILVVNSHVSHDLAASQYGARRAESEVALECLGMDSYRDLDVSMLENLRQHLDETQYRRARHVVTEIARTESVARLIPRGEWHAVGQLLADSHQSLRDDYEVSCNELDLLVQLATEIGSDGGVYGMRMTGGGFGGCAVAIVETERIAQIADQICTRYQERSSIEPSYFSTRPAIGALQLRL